MLVTALLILHTISPGRVPRECVKRVMDEKLKCAPEMIIEFRIGKGLRTLAPTHLEGRSKCKGRFEELTDKFFTPDYNIELDAASL